MDLNIKVNVKVECEPLIQVIKEFCTLLSNKNNSDKVSKISNNENNSEKNSKEVSDNEGNNENSDKKETKKKEAKKEEITAETARLALAELAKERGKKAAKEILNSFGCSKFSDIPKENYQELMKKIEEVE